MQKSPLDIGTPGRRWRSARLRAGVLAALLSVSLTACGSTLEKSEGDALAGANGGGLEPAGGDTSGLPGGEAGSGTTGSSGLDPAGTAAGGAVGGGAVGGGAVGGAAGGSTGTSGSGSTTGGGAGSSTGGVVQGQAKTGKIRLGIITVDTGSFTEQFGKEGTDTSGPVERFIKYLNSTGGYAGRLIEPVYYKVDGSKDPNTASQEACEKFKDGKAEIVMNSGGGDVLTACLARAGILFLDSNVLANDGVDVARFRNRLLPNAMRVDRLHGANLRIASQRGLLKRGDTVGIMLEDCIWAQRTMRNTLLPLANELGVKVVQGTHRCIQNLASDIGPVTSDIQREVLRFNREGVTRVVGVSTAEAFILSRFTQTASQQRYFPKYLVTSQAYPYTNSRPGATIYISRDALPNIYGVGYLQMWDVGDNDKVPTLQAQERERCRKAEPSQGTATGRTDNQYYFLRQAFWAACDGFFALRVLLEATKGDSSIAAMTRAYPAALGNHKKVSAGLTGGYHEVTSNRLDGAGYLRPFAWNASKDTFLYTGPPVAVP